MLSLVEVDELKDFKCLGCTVYLVKSINHTSKAIPQAVRRRKNFSIAFLLMSVVVMSACTSVMRAISKSNVSSDEMRSVLLQSADVPGWSIDPTIESSAADSAIAKLEDQTCDIDAVEEGATYTAPAGDFSVYSSAEPVCGTGAESREATILGESTYFQVFQEALVANVAAANVAVSDFSYTRVDLGLGSDTLAYLVTAQLTGPESSAPFEAYQVSIFSDRLGATVLMQAFGRVVPQDELLRLSNIVKSRVLALD